MGRAHVRNLSRRQEVRVYRRRVACPACGWHLIDTCARGPIDIADMQAKEAPPWEPDFVARCQRCKNEFAIRKPHNEDGCRPVN